MSSTNIGRSAEGRVADYLRQQGYKIHDKNWRTRWCEIDIVAEKDDCVYFVEVKYRHANDWGDGFEAITPTKLQQMTRSAEFWIHHNNWKNEALLMAAAVDDDSIEVIILE